MHLYAEREARDCEVPCNGLERLRLFVCIGAADEAEVAHEEVACVEARLVGSGEEVEEVPRGVGRGVFVFYGHHLRTYSQLSMD